MKSLICISHVPDTTTKIKYTPDGKSLDTQDVTFIINPYDEFGLVRAIEFKEQSGEGQVTVLCVGGAEVEPTLRKALAIGADDAVRIDAKPQDGYSVARMISDYAKDKGYDLIFCGKESIDNNAAVVPGMISEMMDMPFVSLCIKLDVEGGKAKLHREIDGGYEELESDLPMVVSCQKGMSEWRIPNMRGIMSARTKPLQVVPASDVSPAVTTEHLELPPAKGGVTYIDPENPEKLVQILHEQGVI